MLNIKNLKQFTDRAQTSIKNVVMEYCEHLFLSYLYQQQRSEQLLFKGGTSLRIVFGSPRYSEDLDFTGVSITHKAVDELFTNTLVVIEKTGIRVELEEGKPTTGGYLGRASFHAYGRDTSIQIEVSLRNGRRTHGVSSVIENDYIPAYTLVHLSTEEIIKGKMQALINRHKPRDFYDYFFLLSGNYPLVKEKSNLTVVRALLKETKYNFRNELRELLPASHAMHLKDFKRVLEQKIVSFGG